MCFRAQAKQEIMCFRAQAKQEMQDSRWSHLPISVRVCRIHMGKVRFFLALTNFQNRTIPKMECFTPCTDLALSKKQCSELFNLMLLPALKGL